jgi:uncharacterized repeat protein (TIGR03803 family)
MDFKREELIMRAFAFFAVGLGTWASAMSATAATTYVQLHAFTTAEAQCPNGALLLSKDGSLYGMTQYGGSNGKGTVYALDPSGALRVLHNFGRGKSDGATPNGSLIEVDNVLYGVTRAGGASNRGVAFKLTKQGRFTLLHSFAGDIDGVWPQGPLVLATDGNLYGTTGNEGVSLGGTLFRMDTAGNVTTLWNMERNGAGPYDPRGGLMQASDGRLYGTSLGGGARDDGTVYSYDLDGTRTIVHDFGSTTASFPDSGVMQGRDGAFYGTTHSDSWDATGDAFRVTAAGDYSEPHHFSNAAGEGWGPEGRLVEPNDDVFLGTTDIGGTYSGGTLYRMTLGGDFKYLHMFGEPIEGGGVDGSTPEAGLTRTGKGEYVGTTCNGGAADAGTIYRLQIK